MVVLRPIRWLSSDVRTRTHRHPSVRSFRSWCGYVMFGIGRSGEVYYTYTAFICDLQWGNPINYVSYMSTLTYTFCLACQLFFRASICEELTRRAEQTGTLMTEISQFEIGDDIELRIQNFIFGVLHNNFKIEIFGLFAINMQHVLQLVATMTGYLIILIQVELTK
ncbi:uncharacterized protein LOC134220680 [Armigeres subalbatus]|uniref:uncharacterized protein LOC134220680 n=1 Tax=Armigeres subalbatus TaxID=124917 RepID=UPI002ED23A4D